VTECPAYNPFDRDVLEDPFSAYAKMRPVCPVHRFDGHDPAFYTAFTYDAVVEIVMNRDDWTARYGISPKFQRGVGFNTDGPEHLKFRRAVLSGLTPRNIEALTPDITTEVDGLIDGMRRHGPGDFHELFAGPLPIGVFIKPARRQRRPEAVQGACRHPDGRGDEQHEPRVVPAHRR
jgi:cytochrome P450